MADQIIERQRGHVAGSAVGRMHGAVEMGARVHRGLDALGDDADGLQVLRVIHLVAGITDPAGGVDAHGVGQIDDLHGAFPACSRGAPAWYKNYETGKPHEARSPCKTAFGRHRRSHRSRRPRPRGHRVAGRHRFHRADLSGEPEISDRAQHQMLSEPHRIAGGAGHRRVQHPQSADPRADAACGQARRARRGDLRFRLCRAGRRRRKAPGRDRRHGARSRHADMRPELHGHPQSAGARHHL